MEECVKSLKKGGGYRQTPGKEPGKGTYRHRKCGVAVTLDDSSAPHRAQVAMARDGAESAKQCHKKDWDRILGGQERIGGKAYE